MIGIDSFTEFPRNLFNVNDGCNLILNLLFHLRSHLLDLKLHVTVQIIVLINRENAIL